MEHPEALEGASELADIYIELGRLSELEQLLNKALRVWKRRCCIQHHLVNTSHEVEFLEEQIFIYHDQLLQLISVRRNLKSDEEAKLKDSCVLRGKID